MNQEQLSGWVKELESLYRDGFSDLSFLEDHNGALTVLAPDRTWSFIRFELPSKQFFHLHSVDLRDTNGARLTSPDIGIVASSHHGRSLKLLKARNFLIPEHAANFGFHTSREMNPWLHLSFPSPVRLGEIVVRNRKDSCAARAAGMRVCGSTNGLEWEILYDGTKRIREFDEKVSALWRCLFGENNEDVVREFSVDMVRGRYAVALSKFAAEKFPADLRESLRKVVVDVILAPRGLEWAGGRVRLLPRTCFYSFGSARLEKQKKSLKEFKGELEVKEYSSAIILPLRKTGLSKSNVYEGGVCDEEFRFIAGYQRKKSGNETTNNTCVRAYDAGNDVETRDESVVFLGIHNKHFGHFLTDGLSRLHALKLIQPDTKLAYVYVPSKGRVFYQEVLALLGIDPGRLLIVDRSTKFKSVYVPDQSLYFFESFHRDFLKPYDEILKNLSIKSDRKRIYLSRTRLATPDCVNERYFEEFYSSMGFDIIHPQELSFEEQVAVIHGAQYIVSTVGTLTHLAVFARPGTRLVGLMRASDFIPKIQHSIDRLRELDSVYVDVSCNFLPSHRRFESLYIGPNECWRKFANDEYGMRIKYNIFEYINGESSGFGTYIAQWLRCCSNARKVRYVENASARDLMTAIRVAEQSYFKRQRV